MSGINVVAHNMHAMFSNRELGIVNNRKAKSAEKLSSGYKINRAADDAAGLSISEKMRKQIRGLSQGTNNIQDGISLCQVTDGAMEEITECLQRIHELSIKAYNGTNSRSDRQDIQDEIEAVRTEIQRIADTTKFNDTYVLKGDPLEYGEITPAQDIVRLQDTTITKELPDWLKVDKKLSLHNESGDESVHTVNPGTSQDTSGYCVVNTSPLEFYGPNSSPGNINIDGFNISTTGGTYKGAWTADMSNNRYASIDFSGLTSVSSAEELYGDLVDLVGSSIGVGCSTCESISGNNSRHYYGITFLGNEAGFEATDLSSIIYSNTTGTYSVTPVSTDLSSWKPFNGADADKTVFDRAKEMILRHNNDNTLTADQKKAEAQGLADEIAKALSKDTWNKLNLRCTSDGHYNRVLPQDDDYSITIYDYRDTDKIPQGVDMSVETSCVVNGKLEVSEHEDATYGYHRSPLEIQAGADNLRDDRIPIKLPLIDNAVMGISDYSVARYTTVTSYTDDFKRRMDAYDNDYTDVPTTINHPAWSEQVNETKKVTHVSVEAGEVKTWSENVPTGNTRTVNHQAWTEIRYNRIYNSPRPIPGPDDYVSVTEYTPDDFTIISDAIKYVSAERSRIGAEQNRLEHAYKVNTNTVENTQNAESVIRDTDMAEEMVKFSKEGILQQAGQAMLAQANQANQGVLSLIQ